VKHVARWTALGVAVVVVVFGVILALNVGSDPQADAQKNELLGKPAPEVSLETIDGRALTSADLAGKTVIVNFWNTWCIPCQEELPALKQFYADHQGDGDVLMVGIVRRDDTKTVRQFVNGEGIGWTIALDPSKAAALDFGTRGQPETFALSPSGQIVAFKAGPMSRGDLEQFLNAGRLSG
jgi:cytochrome c biogenesis protein CcmG, thiol:disulfide interchange protein DsbE